MLKPCPPLWGLWDGTSSDEVIQARPQAGMSVLIQRGRQSCLPGMSKGYMSAEHAAEGSCLRAWKREICQHLHLRLPASSAERYRCVLFKLRSVRILLQQPEQTKTGA